MLQSVDPHQGWQSHTLASLSSTCPAASQLPMAASSTTSCSCKPTASGLRLQAPKQAVSYVQQMHTRQDNYKQRQLTAQVNFFKLAGAPDLIKHSMPANLQTFYCYRSSTKHQSPVLTVLPCSTLILKHTLFHAQAEEVHGPAAG